MSVVLAIALAFAGMACGGEPPPAPPPTPSETARFELPTMDFAAVAAVREIREVTQTQLDRGQQCGWRAGWMGAVREARQEAPGRFRSAAVGRAFTWGVVFLVLGGGGTLLLAWILPRRRRKALHRSEAPPSEHAPPTPSWVVWFKGLVGRFFARLGRLLHVEQFDPLLADERQRMIATCHDAERQLTVTTAVLGERAPTTPSIIVEGADPVEPTRDRKIAREVDAWRGEVVVLRRRLEGAAPLPPELAPDRASPRLAVVARAARDLRLLTERALISGATGDTLFTELERDLAERPETPRERAHGPATPLPGWVRTVGWSGLGAMALGLVMLACWMAAGGFPLFFALLFALAGIVAVLLARVHLHRAGRLPLLPGFADGVARWLTGVTALALLATMISSWMSTESGLDLGDPPPVAMPDPKALDAPRFFASTRLPKTLPTPVPVPVPVPVPTPPPETAPAVSPAPAPSTTP